MSPLPVVNRDTVETDRFVADASASISAQRLCAVLFMTRIDVSHKTQCVKCDLCYVSHMTRFGIEAIYDLVKAGVAEHGVRPFARKLDMPIGVIRSAEAGRDLSASSLSTLSNALGLEFYIGPPRETAPAAVTVLDEEPFDMVARYDAQSAAGNGTVNFEGPPIDHLAFSKKWLGQNGINAGASVLINVKGDSMEPSIYDGDLVMVDQRKREIRSGRIYVFWDGDNGLRLKRLETVGDAAITIRSDNTKYPPEHRTGGEMNQITEHVLGEVVWSGHKWG